ncbi:SIP domain-containing protein, partial [Streptomyces sp. 8K308]|uniref:siderophore-interacting protein n=1 Tax=Streptomyces sp. 8K308 TaxID=2530388 RepID=UPI003266FF05
MLGPTEEDNGGVDFRPPPDTDQVLIAGDSSALPAIAGILAWLPAGLPARVWIETQHVADRQHLSTRAEAEITWLPHGRLRTALRTGDDPPAPPAVTAQRRRQPTPQATRVLARERSGRAKPGRERAGTAPA